MNTLRGIVIGAALALSVSCGTFGGKTIEDQVAAGYLLQEQVAVAALDAYTLNLITRGEAVDIRERLEEADAILDAAAAGKQAGGGTVSTALAILGSVKTLLIEKGAKVDN